MNLSVARAPRLLWAAPVCLLDRSNGAARSVQQMLRQLSRLGWEIRIVGATIFDDAGGAVGLGDHWPAIRERHGQWISYEDGALTHLMLVTGATGRWQLTSLEEALFFEGYRSVADAFRPDYVFFFGGLTLELLVAAEARAAGIRTVFYLVNGQYSGDGRWHRDIDLVLTDSLATADFYAERTGRKIVAIGTFVDPAAVRARAREPRRVLFVNPIAEKGALWVAALALWLEDRRPDILFEIVEARGRWSDILAAVAPGRPELGNVVVAPPAEDMRPFYARARLLLAPSLWWESGARVLVEAMLNGIPAICTGYGGGGEMIGDGGIILSLDPQHHQPPYHLPPAAAEVEALAALVERLYDDQPFYEALAGRAERAGEDRHGLGLSTWRLVRALTGL